MVDTFIYLCVLTYNIPFANQATNRLRSLALSQVEIFHHPLLAESVGVPTLHVSKKPPHLECGQTSDALLTPNLDCHDSAASELYADSIS